jgi:hypothetical protein
MMDWRGLFCGMLLGLLGVVLPAAAQDAPDVPVRALYALTSDRADGDGVPLWQDPDTAGRLFTPALLDLFAAADARAKANPGKVPKFVDEPFYDAEKWDIANLVVTAGEIAAERAKAIVTFDNFGEPSRLEYILERTDAGWRINDIVYKHVENERHTLSEILSGG